MLWPLALPLHFCFCLVYSLKEDRADSAELPVWLSAVEQLLMLPTRLPELLPRDEQSPPDLDKFFLLIELHFCGKRKPEFFCKLRKNFATYCVIFGANYGKVLFLEILQKMDCRGQHGEVVAACK